MRTCVGCRRRDEAEVLFRVVAVPVPGPGQEVRLVPDARRRLPGRGAWVHPDTTCVDRAIRRRAFARALRVNGPLDVGLLSDAVLHPDHREQVPER